MICERKELSSLKFKTPNSLSIDLFEFGQEGLSEKLKYTMEGVIALRVCTGCHDGWINKMNLRQGGICNV